MSSWNSCFKRKLSSVWVLLSFLYKSNSVNFVLFLFLAFYESNICSVWKLFVFSSRRLTLKSMLIDYYFRSNASRNLTDEFTRGGRWGRSAPLSPLNRNLHLWYENKNSPWQMMTNGHAINFCQLPRIYFTDQRRIFDDN